MGGRRRLRAERPRVHSREDGRTGLIGRSVWAALREEYDVRRGLALELARRVIAAAVNADHSTRVLEAARRARMTGTGRRPSPRDIERLARRQGLDEAAYGQALAQLRELAGQRPRPTVVSLEALR
jgi:hypothetical protein